MQHLATSWTLAEQASLSMGFQSTVLEWVAISYTRYVNLGYNSKVLSITTLLSESTNGILQTNEAKTFQPGTLEERTSDHCL